MKKIEAIIRPHLLEAVRNALLEEDVIGMTMSEVQGFGRQPGHTETYRGAEYQIEHVTKLKLELIVPDYLVDAAVRAVIKQARTGEFGDGMIFITPLEEVLRISTGERGEAAI